jgi:hypothetical protein
MLKRDWERSWRGRLSRGIIRGNLGVTGLAAAGLVSEIPQEYHKKALEVAPTQFDPDFLQ